MIAKIKKKFLHVDYQLIEKNVEFEIKKDMNVKEYIEEFYKLDIRSRHVDDEVEKVARYLNGL